MSFNSKARIIRNLTLPMKYRHQILKNVLTNLADATKRTYPALRSKYMIWENEFPTEAELLLALNALEIVRNRHLEKLRVYEHKRIREKMRGRRHPRKADVEALFRDETEDGEGANENVGRENRAE